jgi:hypothetical protein
LPAATALWVLLGRYLLSGPSRNRRAVEVNGTVES